MRLRRIIGWTLAVLGIVLLAGAVAGYWFLKSASFQRIAIRTIIKDANEATGARTDIGGFDFQLSTLTAHLYNITMHGDEPSSQPPLLHADKLTVGLQIQSILLRKVTLSELSIEHPVVNVRVDRNGKSNIPQSPPSSSSGSTNVFDLAARHVLVTGGEVGYNDATVPLDAELYGLRTEIRFDWLATRYHGSVSYDNGRLRYADISPLQHSFNASFSATPSRLSLESAVLKVGSSALSLHADMRNYLDLAIDGSYDLRIHTADFVGLMRPVTAVGDVSLSGAIHYQNSNHQPLLRAISIDGRLASDRLAASSPEGHIDLRELRGRYELANGALQARDVAFETLDGKVTAEVDAQHLDAAPVFRVRTALQGISVQAAQRTIREPQIRRVDLLGRINGTAEASWTGSINNLRARADLNLTAPALTAPASGADHSSTTIPVSGDLHATYAQSGDRSGNVITLAASTLRIPSATVTAQGELSRHSNLQIKATADDLHQLAALIAAVSGQPAPIEIAGSASVQATVHGTLQKPVLTGQLSAQNLQVRGSQWSSATVKVQASPSEIVLQDAVLASAHQGKASLNANIRLQNWSYVPSDPIVASLMVQHMSIADFQHLANVNYPVSGDLTADISFRGSQLAPAGNGTAKIDNARAYCEPIQHLAATFRAVNNSATSTIDVSMPAGSANGSVSYTPKTKAYTVRLSAPSVTLQKLQLVQEKHLGLAGNLTISASGEGTLDNPQLVASVAVPQLSLRDKSISQIKGDLQIANHRAELKFDSEVAQASVHSHAIVNLDGDYYAEATIDTAGFPLDPLLATYVTSLPQGFHGETELHATLKGPLKDKSRIEAHLTIPILKASYQSLEIAAAEPIRVDYSNSAITLQPAEIRGTSTSLRVQGSVPLNGSATPNLSAKGSIDLHILRIFEPDVTSAGTLALDIHASGTANNPAIQGQIHLQDVALSTPDAPLGIEKLNGTLNINNNAVYLSGVGGQVGGGRLSLGGSISYRPALQFNVTMQSTSVRLLYPTGLRTILDGNLMLSGTKDASTLNGRVLIDSLSFTHDFDLAKFSSQFGNSIAPAEPGLADNIKLAVGVQSKGDLSATSSQLTLEGQVNLQVVGTVANPVIIGRTNLTSGELFYRNVRYQLERGIITFDNPNETQPTLSVSATTTVEQYNLTLNLRGTFDKLVTSYTSDPPLATADVINLIARGTTTQEQNAASQSTDSMIASQVTSQLTSSIQQLAGISALQIDPLLGGNNQNPAARVAIQQRVTKNFLFTFSTDLSQPGTEVVQGDYQLNKRWSVTVTRDEVGGIAVNGKYHTRF